MKPPITSEQIEAALDQAFKAVFKNQPTGETMRYEWETEITQAMLNKINDILPDGLVLRGVAVENIMQVEGAMIERTAEGYPDCLAPVDVWTDIKGDTDCLREGYYRTSQQRRCQVDEPREVNQNRPSKNPFEPPCQDCGLPHPSRNPYCFCKPDRTAPLETIRKMREAGQTWGTKDDAQPVEMPEGFWDDAVVVKRVEDGDRPPLPLSPRPNGDGTYDRRHLWAYGVAAMEGQRGYCIAHAKGLDGPQPPNCVDVAEKAATPKTSQNKD